MPTFLEPWFNSLHKIVSWLSFNVMRIIVMQNVELWRNKSETASTAENQDFQLNFLLFLGDLDI